VSPPAPRKRPSTLPAPSTFPDSATSQTRDLRLDPEEFTGSPTEEIQRVAAAGGVGPGADRRLWRTHRGASYPPDGWQGVARRLAKPGPGPVQPPGVARFRPPGVRSSAHAVWTSAVIP